MLATAVLNANAEPLRAELATPVGNRAVYREGDPIRLLLSLNKPAYLLIIYENSLGYVHRIFPNHYRREARLGAAEFLPLPEDNDSYRWVAGAPYGEDRIWLIAAESPLPPWTTKRKQRIDAVLRRYRSWSHASKTPLQIKSVAVVVQPKR